MQEIPSCPFCNLSDRVLKENEYAEVILSNPRKVYGHFLVIPKRHIEEPWELKPEELQAIFDLIFYIEGKIIPKLGDGVDIRQNYRPFLRQNDAKVNHITFHVVPRSQQDRIYEVAERYDDGLFQPLEPDEHDEIAAILED